MRTSMRVLTAVLVPVVLLTGCRGGSETGSPSTPKSAATVAPVGANGGTVTAGAFSVEVPSGAVTSNTHVTVKPVTQAPSTQAATVLKPLSTQVDVALDGGAQPARPLTISAAPSDPATTAAARSGSLKMLSRDSRTGAWDLTPATWDAAHNVIRARTSHLSIFSFVTVDVSAPVNAMLDVVKGAFELDGATKPACAGKPLKDGDVTYELDSRYRGKGDGIVWPCLSRGASGRIDLQLSNATGLPWLIRSRPQAKVTDSGAVDINRAVLQAFYRQFLDGGQFSQSMVLPGAVNTYAFDADQLPGYADLELDGFAQQSMALIWGPRFALDLFYPEAAVVKALGDADFGGCVGDLVATATGPFNARTVGIFVKTFFSCAGTVVTALGGTLAGVAKVVVAAMSGGISLILNDLIGAYREAFRHSSTRVTISTRSASLHLTPQGVGSLHWGTGGSSAEQALRGTLGTPDRVTDGPSCELGGGDPGRLRVLTWGALSIWLQGSRLKGAVQLRAWQVRDGTRSFPLLLPHGLEPGATFRDVQGTAPGAKQQAYVGGESELVDRDGVEYLFDTEQPSAGDPVSMVTVGTVPCD